MTTNSSATPSNPASLERDIARAREAEQLNQNPLLAEAFDRIEADILAKLKTAPVRDKAGRDELVTLLQLNERYRKGLQHFIDNGKVAEQQLSWLAKMKRRVAA